MNLLFYNFNSTMPSDSRFKKNSLGKIAEETEASMECDEGAEVMLSTMANTCTDRQQSRNGTRRVTQRRIINCLKVVNGEQEHVRVMEGDQLFPPQGLM